MEPRCTCGATLPPDARFCHKCGKPQREELLPEVVEQEAPVVVPPGAAKTVALPGGISFRNAVAVRVGFLAAGFVCLLIGVLSAITPFALLVQVILLTASGFFSVYLYQRRTGEFLSMISGARLGGITGVLCFVIMMVMFTIGVLTAGGGEGLSAQFREQLAATGRPEVMDQLDTILREPTGFAIMLFTILLVSFFMLTVLPAVGGALGAKVLEKE